VVREGSLPPGYTLMSNSVVPAVSGTGTLFAIHELPRFTACTPLIQTSWVRSLTVPVTVMYSWESWSVLRGSMVVFMPLRNTVKGRLAVWPHTLLAVTVKKFVGPAKSRPATRKAPPRSTTPSTVPVPEPLTETDAVSSSSKPRSVKLVPATGLLLSGQVMVMAGGFVLLEGSKHSVVNNCRCQTMVHKRRNVEFGRDQS